MSTASLNEVRLIGNLGGDPDVRPVGDKLVATINIATTYYRGNEEFVEWHRVVLWNNLAERAQKYLRKGSSVYIAGRLSTRKWKDDQSQDRYTTEVVAEGMQMLGGSRRAEGEGDGAAPHEAPPKATGGKRSSAPPADQAPTHQADDIPF